MDTLKSCSGDPQPYPCRLQGCCSVPPCRMEGGWQGTWLFRTKAHLECDAGAVRATSSLTPKNSATYARVWEALGLAACPSAIAGRMHELPGGSGWAQAGGWCPVMDTALSPRSKHRGGGLLAVSRPLVATGKDLCVCARRDAGPRDQTDSNYPRGLLVLPSVACKWLQRKRYHEIAQAFPILCARKTPGSRSSARIAAARMLVPCAGAAKRATTPASLEFRAQGLCFVLHCVSGVSQDDKKQSVQADDSWGRD